MSLGACEGSKPFTSFRMTHEIRRCTWLAGLGQILLGVLVFLLVVVIIAAGFGIYTVRRSFPQVKGDIQVNGLDGPVDIYRDEFGIPHIYAATEHDLFFAQGYVHAQDRFWQMDFWRHIGSGRLSEMFGKSQLDTDKFLRTWAGRAWPSGAETIDPESRHSAEPTPTASMPTWPITGQRPQPGVCRAQADSTADYQPEPWQPLHTLTWAKAMAWDLGGNMDDEIAAGPAHKSFTPAQVAELYPPYPTDHPVIVPGFSLPAGIAASSGQQLARSSDSMRRCRRSADKTPVWITSRALGLRASAPTTG